MDVDRLPPPPVKHLDAVSSCACLQSIASDVMGRTDRRRKAGGRMAAAKSWHLGQGTLVLLTDSDSPRRDVGAGLVGGQEEAAEMPLLRNLLLDRQLQVTVRDGPHYCSVAQLPANYSFLIFSSSYSSSSLVAGLGLGDEDHPASLSVLLGTKRTFPSSSSSATTSYKSGEMDYVMLSDEEDIAVGSQHEEESRAGSRLGLGSRSGSGSGSPEVVVALPKPVSAGCWEAVSEADWRAMRVWWALCVSHADRHMRDLTMDEEVQLAVERDFVAARQRHQQVSRLRIGKKCERKLILLSSQDPLVNPNVSEVDLHRWLRLVRLKTVSSFETSISLERWQDIRSMEEEKWQRRRFSSIPINIIQ